MKRSAAARQRNLVAASVVLVVLDVSARLAVPLGSLALLRGRGKATLVAAALVSALAVVRGLVGGWLVARVGWSLWQDVVGATRRYRISDLRRHGDEGGELRLINAVYSHAQLRASALPRLVADAMGLVAVCATVPWLLGIGWLLVGLAALVTVSPILLLGQRRLRAAGRRAIDLLAQLGADFRALVAGAAELRGQGREEALAEGLLNRARSMVAEQGRMASHSALTGLLPFAAALVVLTLPLGGYLRAWANVDHHRHLAEIGVLGGAALVFGMGLLRGIEAWVRDEPHRAALARFLRAAGEAAGGQLDTTARGARRSAARHAADPGLDDGWCRPIELMRVGVTYPGSRVATPHGIDLIWPTGKGLAVLGDNGSGKTTLGLVVLGLAEPTEGHITLGGVCLSACDLDGLRSRAVYLPQNAFVDPVRSVGWHLRLVVGAQVGESTLRRALHAVGLGSALRRAGEQGADLELPMGSLSGGERRRVQLARLFIEPERLAPVPELYVVDEPEAELDADGRALLTDRLAALAERARVLLIAHDPRVVPAGFTTVTCRRGPAMCEGETGQARSVS